MCRPLSARLCLSAVACLCWPVAQAQSQDGLGPILAGVRDGSGPAYAELKATVEKVLKTDAAPDRAADLADLLLERGRSYVLTAQANRTIGGSASPAEWRQLAIDLYAFVLRNGTTALVDPRAAEHLRAP